MRTIGVAAAVFCIVTAHGSCDTSISVSGWQEGEQVVTRVRRVLNEVLCSPKAICFVESKSSSVVPKISCAVLITLRVFRLSSLQLSSHDKVRYVSKYASTAVEVDQKLIGKCLEAAEVLLGFPHCCGGVDGSDKLFFNPYSQKPEMFDLNCFSTMRRGACSVPLVFL